MIPLLTLVPRELISGDLCLHNGLVWETQNLLDLRLLGTTPMTMRFKAEHFVKALKHHRFRELSAGILILVLPYLIIQTLDPKALGRFHSGAVLAYIFLLVPMYFGSLMLVSGKWTPRKWLLWVLFFITPPNFAFLAYFTATVPEYSVLPITILLVGMLVVIGAAPRKAYVAVGILFCSLYLPTTLFYSDWAFPKLSVFITCLAVLFYCWFVGVTSNHVRKTIVNNSSLLRVSRRDKRIIAEERKRSDNLLLNILPEKVADELKANQSVRPVSFESASVMFTDFKGFTQIAEKLSPEELVGELDRCFSYFDAVVARNGLEKLKTIGDAFMCAGGIPEPNKTHAVDCILAALEIQGFMNKMKEIKSEQGLPYWELRLGIHSGPLVAGVIGEKKFAYDVWGDTVNTASRVESSGMVGRINITESTQCLVNEFFECKSRGQIQAKNKGLVEMYFVNSIHPGLSRDGAGKIPNERFLELRNQL